MVRVGSPPVMPESSLVRVAAQMASPEAWSVAPQVWEKGPYHFQPLQSCFPQFSKHLHRIALNAIDATDPVAVLGASDFLAESPALRTASLWCDSFSRLMPPGTAASWVGDSVALQSSSY